MDILLPSFTVRLQIHALSVLFSYLQAALCAIYVSMPLSLASTICFHRSDESSSKLLFQGLSVLFWFFSKHHFDLIYSFSSSFFPVLLITYKSFYFWGLNYLFLYGHTTLLTSWLPVCPRVFFLSVFCPRVIWAAGVDRRRSETWRGGWEAVCLLIESCSLTRWRGVKDLSSTVNLQDFPTANGMRTNKTGIIVTTWGRSSVLVLLVLSELEMIFL